MIGATKINSSQWLGPRKLIPVKGSSKFLTKISDRVKFVKINILFLHFLHLHHNLQSNGEWPSTFFFLYLFGYKKRIFLAPNYINQKHTVFLTLLQCIFLLSKQYRASVSGRMDVIYVRILLPYAEKFDPGVWQTSNYCQLRPFDVLPTYKIATVNNYWRVVTNDRGTNNAGVSQTIKTAHRLFSVKAIDWNPPQVINYSRIVFSVPVCINETGVTC